MKPERAAPWSVWIGALFFTSLFFLLKPLLLAWFPVENAGLMNRGFLKFNRDRLVKLQSGLTGSNNTTILALGTSTLISAIIPDPEFQNRLEQKGNMPNPGWMRIVMQGGTFHIYRQLLPDLIKSKADVVIIESHLFKENIWSFTWRYRLFYSRLVTYIKSRLLESRPESPWEKQLAFQAWLQNLILEECPEKPDSYQYLQQVRRVVETRRKVFVEDEFTSAKAFLRSLTEAGIHVILLDLAYHPKVEGGAPYLSEWRSRLKSISDTTSGLEYVPLGHTLAASHFCDVRHYNHSGREQISERLIEVLNQIKDGAS